MFRDAGRWHAPTEDEVINPTQFGLDGTGSTGNWYTVVDTNVKAGVNFGVGNLEEGTYDPMAAAVFPADTDVLDTVAAYGPTGAEFAGRWAIADADKYQKDEKFG